MATFDTPDYIMGNSAGITTSLSTVLTTLDQALQALQVAPSATIVKFNNTVRCDAGSTTRTDMTDTSISCVDTNAETLTYTPTQFVQANSNAPTPIPASSVAKHRVILESSDVPIIDTLSTVPWTLPSGETINTFSSDSGSIFLGCESGNVYYFNTSSETWDLQATFDGAVRCIYYEANGSRLYIGGNFNSMLTPAPIGSLNKVCYIGSGLPSLANVSVDIWANYSVNGFDDAVNAIVGNNDIIYFGGRFQNNSNGSLNCKRVASYDWQTTGNLYALDNVSGCGFDNQVWSLSIDTNTFLCVAGEFQNVIESSGTFPANYCCQLTISGTTFNVVQLDFLYANATALTNPITKTATVQTNTTTDFYISTNDSNIAGNGLNYFIQTGFGNSFPSTSQIGNNDAVVQQQFTYQPTQGGNFSIGTNDVYLVNNVIIATIPFSNAYLYWNYHYARTEFYDPATGLIYAFIGSNVNQFTFSGGRGLIYNGTSYFTGFNFPNTGQGYTAELLYGIQGNYYALISNTGNGTPVI
jgi:hypothetical protein